MIRLTDSLLENNSIENLNLSFCEVGEKGIVYFSSFLNTTKKLKFLDLSNNQFNQQSTISFTNSLSVNKTIKNLNLSSCRLEDQSIVYLAESFESNYTLNSVDISSNLLTDQGIQFIVYSLFKNDSILRIDFSFNKFSQNTSQQIHFLLHSNTPWSPDSHFLNSEPFKDSIFSFLLALKLIYKSSLLKIPKFVVYEIIKRVNRKAFFSQLEYHHHSMESQEESLELDDDLSDTE